MRHIAVADMTEDGAAIPSQVLSALGLSTGDRIAFHENDDGSILVAKAPPTAHKRPVGDYIGIFSEGRQRSLEEELALLREMRYGDEASPAV